MMGKKLEECIFCNRDRSVIWRSTNFYLTLDDAPLADGHSLLCPSLHYESSADLPKTLGEEFHAAIPQVIETYRVRYGALTLFEHGRTGHCVGLHSSEALCEHAHVHLVPRKLDLASRVKLYPGVEWESWDSLRDLARDVFGYVMIIDDDGTKLFYPTVRPIPPHYLRTVVAESIGRPYLADWQQVIASAQSEKSIRRGLRQLANLQLYPGGLATTSGHLS
jgi:diadenosine tetraphosphate (Ap4A) HIT family hydrolase